MSSSPPAVPAGAFTGGTAGAEEAEPEPVHLRTHHFHTSTGGAVSLWVAPKGEMSTMWPDVLEDNNLSPKVYHVDKRCYKVWDLSNTSATEPIQLVSFSSNVDTKKRYVFDLCDVIAYIEQKMPDHGFRLKYGRKLIYQTDKPLKYRWIALSNQNKTLSVDSNIKFSVWKLHEEVAEDMEDPADQGYDDHMAELQEQLFAEGGFIIDVPTM